MIDGAEKVDANAEVLRQCFGKGHEGRREVLKALSPLLSAVRDVVVVEEGPDGNAKANVGLLQEGQSWSSVSKLLICGNYARGRRELKMEKFDKSTR